MSISGSTSGISFTGLSSGIDSQSIVNQLIQIESLPLQRMQQQQAVLANRQSLYGQLKSSLVAFNSSVSSLNTAATFNPIKASSSDTDVATLTASSSATAGTYNLTVSKLATTHKVSSSAQASTATALGLSGTFSINGRLVTAEASDTLTTLAAKINSSGASVTASIINGGTGSAYLSLTASKSGADNKIQTADLSGTVLSSLGVVSGAAAVREQVGADTVKSYGFTDGTTDLGVLMNGSGSGSFTIGTAVIAVDLASDSLQDIATKINGDANSNATAQVVTTTVDGKSVSRLSITGSGGALPTITDTNGLLEAIGVYQKSFGNQVIAAQDAAYTLDGYSFTSSSNTVKDVVPGVTITLLKADLTTPETSTLTLTKDNDKVGSSVKDMVKSYNDIVDFIANATKFDTETFVSGPLFGDAAVAQVQTTLASKIFANIGTGTVKNLAQIGFELDKDGKLSLDQADFDAALASDPESVRKLMMAVGESSTTNIKFVSSTSATKNSNGDYQVNISQVATLTSMLAGTVQTTANTAGETLTFNGGLFANSAYVLTVPIGSNLSALVSQINSDTKLSGLLTASIDGGGALKLESKRYGTPGAFTVTSNLAAAADNSGIGTTGGTYTAGLDVAGTINGLATTGNGQFLTGASGTDIEGLQIQYVGSTTGIVGTMKYQRGVAAELTYGISLFTDTVNGLLTSSDKSLQSQIDDISSRMENLKTTLAARRAMLQKKFLAMERAVSEFQGQQARLSAMMTGKA